ncbi:glycoside hydrolase family 11 protein [Ruminococcus sp.]|uniref:glycoside hydrolase family 11 protein n=1 Tax=Ruminococcus sp. TaxID=41978 RepID=UPI0025CF4AA0|nr:glycoside hydrolase family 11 protein [Ruminococcus sp.]MCR4639658.1 glycoside hydrolase family 11 protein [Ruminococcus sp.]
MKKTFRQIIGSAVTALMAAASLSAVHSANAADQQIKGNIGGYDYEMWNQNGQGQVSMTPKAGSFTCSWSNVDNFLASMGRIYDSQKNYKYLSNITLSYDVEFTPRGNSFMYVYGWTRNPLTEYYIVEGWGDWRPPGGSGEKKGTIALNGNIYDICKTMRYNQPSIDGTATFPQYWSVRQTSGSRNNATNNMKGTVDVSKHFDAWSKAGLDMSGALYEVSLNIEGFRSSGSANVKGISFYGYIPEPTSEYTTEPTTVPEPPQPDEYGYFFRDEFDNGIGNWLPRGGTVGLTGADGFKGTDGIIVLDRIDGWNGAALELDPLAFTLGNTYSFGALVKQNSESSTAIRMTLQYSDGVEYCYDTIAEVNAPKGEWADLSNTSYTIPSGASELTLCIEAPDSLTDFYIDSAFGGVKDAPSISDVGDHTVIVPGNEITTSTTESKKHVIGDINGDGVIDSFDLAPLRRGILKMMSGSGSTPANADVNGDGAVNVADLVLLQKYIIGKEKAFPDPVTTTTTKAVTTTTQKIVTTTVSATTSSSGRNLNADIRKDMPTSVPGGNEKSGGCKVEKKTYNCKFTGGQKSCNVILPPNYNASKQYPVMYVLHGIGGNEGSMVNGMGVQELLAGLIENGKAEEMIIVLPSQYTSKNGSGGGFGINQEVCAAYDNFLYDISDSLIPFIEANYPVKTGRENRAITGFSMGGREAIYIGLMRPDLFAYVGGACPAPGITPGKDMFMEHPGCMTESEMKFRDVGPEPNVFMITGGTNDGVVGTFPKQYSDILTRNGVDHVYQSIPGGGHDAGSVKPHLYTFMRYAFK